MQKKDCFELGKITQPHGLVGDVTVHLDVDEPEAYIEFRLKVVREKSLNGRGTTG